MLSAVSSVIMVSAMAVSSITASAVTTPNSGSEGEDAAKVLHTVSSASDLTFTINKDIVLFNEDALTIFEPNVTYTYTVAPASVTAGTTITGLTADDEDGDGLDSSTVLFLAIALPLVVIGVIILLFTLIKCKKNKDDEDRIDNEECDDNKEPIIRETDYRTSEV